MTHSAIAFGMIVDNKLDVRTVGPTARSVAVNYLVVNKGLRVSNFWSDHQIMETLEMFRGSDYIAELDIRIGMRVSL